MRLLHLYWPHLPLALTLARPMPAAEPSLGDPPTAPGPSGVPGRGSDSSPAGPLILGGQPWTDGTVIDADPIARSLGVRRGMALGAAHRLAPEATFLDPEPEADAAAVEAAFERLAAFCPGLAGTSDHRLPSFGLLELQVDGLERLWGDERRLVRRLAEAVAPMLPGSPRAGVASVRSTALIAASQAVAGGDPVVVERGGEAAFLAPLPVALLTQDPDIRARLVRFGLRRIGAVAVLPRSALLARFGEEGARLHARARGEETDPFRPRRSPERLALGLPIEPPVTDLEPLRFVLRRLAGALADQLLARGMAADRIRIDLTLDTTFVPRAPRRMAREQRFPEPTADAEAIERLALARLETERPPAPVERLELELLGVTASSGQQLPLFVPQAARDARLAWQLARLALVHGEDRLLRAELLDPEASLPERRARWVPATTAGAVGSTGSDR
jgi:nucleotidyltransferase/DNA polymerase involved in DNA repair